MNLLHFKIGFQNTNSSTSVKKEFISKRRSLYSIVSIESLIISLLRSRVHLKDELDFLEDLKKSGKEVGGMVKMIEREVRKGVKDGESELFQRKISTFLY